MTAQPIDQPVPLPRIPKTLRAIRAALPPRAQEFFDADWAEADLTDLQAVAKLRDLWWGRAMFETNPQAQEDFARLARGELELVPPPYRR